MHRGVPWVSRRQGRLQICNCGTFGHAHFPWAQVALIRVKDDDVHGPRQLLLLSAQDRVALTSVRIGFGWDNERSRSLESDILLSMQCVYMILILRQ